MKSKIAYLLLIFTISSNFLVKAENYHHSDYDWEEERGRIELDNAELLEPVIMLKNVVVNEYAYQEPDKNLVQYSTVHRILRVNSDDAIEAHNKIYIPTSDIIRLISLKARSINPDGKIIELDKNNIKEIKDEENSEGYKIFAIEGVEKGSEIEYYYVAENDVNFFGREYFQYSIPLKNLKFKLISPENLEFEYKTYNDCPEPKVITEDGKRIIDLEINDIDASAIEAFTYYNPNRKRVEYKLARNTQNQSSEELFTWNDAARRVYENIYFFEKKESKSLKKLYRKLKIKKLETEKEKINAIENYLKTNFMVQEGNNPEMSDIDFILETNYGSRVGIVKLYAGLFRMADINHQLAMTTNRSDTRFDKDFQSWNFLVNYLFYFPGQDLFLAPDRIEFRLGMIPYDYTNNYGLFVEKVDMGQFETGTGKVKYIPPLAHDQNFDNLSIEIDFASDMENINVDFMRSLGGYSGASIQPFYLFLPEDQRKDVIETLIKMSAEDAEINEFEVKNVGMDLSPLENPFEIKANFNTSSLLQRAGNKMLFKIGEIIGPQSELYQESERKLDVENDYNRMYNRQIEMKIPSGYSVRNLEDIKISEFFEQAGEKLFNFNSDYQLRDNLLTITIKEYYKKINCSVENFEDFRKVINAAADFNKVTLLLEKDS